MQIHPLLQRPICELPFSQNFINMAAENDLPTVAALLEKKVNHMMELTGFNYHSLEELVKFLHKNELTQYLKES